ncbi:MAG TPA: hypothetical protein VGP06_11715, partial [Janthinobacterium sp.]|nr:hypothetical protein [Janthinobacterium sp.]
MSLSSALLSANCRAQDLSLLAGQMKVNEKDDKSFAVALNYLNPVGNYAALGLSYLNEGHPQGHHRDGIAAQAWLRTPPSAAGFSFGAGLGKYYYFDTAQDNLSGYQNDHGWANIASLSASWFWSERGYAQVQLTRLYPNGKDGTTLMLVGAGYRFTGVPGNKLHLDSPSSDDTLTLSGGQGIVNSFNSERSRALSVEYRRAIEPYVDWSVTALKEGDTARTERQGVATQLWLIRSLTTKVELGMGAGPYAATDLPDESDGRRSHLAGLVSVAARYHFNKRLVAQLSWN